MRYIIPVLFLILAASVSAADIDLVQPASGQTVGSEERFTFTVGSSEMVDTCNLMIDGQLAKSATYNKVLRGNTLSFSMIDEQGEHTWTVECSTSGGKITAPAAPFTLAIPETVVKVTSSGVMRGSLVHSFTMENNAAQDPVVVPRVATGDFVEIAIKVAPSTLKKEYYIRQKQIKDGKAVLWLTFKQEDIYLTEGENTTLNITNTARVIATIRGIENNRAVLVFYPNVRVTEQPEELPEEPETPTTSEEPETPEPTPEPETPNEPEPREGIFKRFIGWLTSIFGA